MALHDLPPIPADLALDDDRVEPVDLEQYERLPDPIDETPDDGEIRARADRWRIVDDGAAEWALRKLAAKRSEIDELAIRRDGWIDRITGWFDSAAKPLQRSIDLLEQRLVDYAAEQYAAGRSPLKLPSGKITNRSAGGTISIDEPAVVVDWISEHIPEQAASLIKREPRLGDLSKAVSVVERVGWYEWTLGLDCGHTTVHRDDLLDQPEPAPTHVGCYSCPPDPVDGVTALRSVTSAEREAITERIVVSSDGEPVPGVSVKPSVRNFTVKPG